MSEQSINKIFEELTAVLKGQGEIKERLAKVEERLGNSMERTDRDYTAMLSLITSNNDDVSAKVRKLQEGHTDQEAVLNVRQGSLYAWGKIFQIVLAFIGSGAVAGGIVWLIIKLVGK